MRRFLILFVVLASLSLGMMAAVLSQYGYGLFAPEARIMSAVAVAVAAYVAWRISTILRHREQDLTDFPIPGGAGKSKLAALFAPRSKALKARQANLEARRKRLIEAGKLEAEEAPAPPPSQKSDEKPVRAEAGAAIKDRMAARAERVRRAREEGKLD